MDKTTQSNMVRRVARLHSARLRVTADMKRPLQQALAPLQPLVTNWARFINEMVGALAYWPEMWLEREVFENPKIVGIEEVQSTDADKGGAYPRNRRRAYRSNPWKSYDTWLLSGPGGPDDGPEPEARIPGKVLVKATWTLPFRSWSLTLGRDTDLRPLISDIPAFILAFQNEVLGDRARLGLLLRLMVAVGKKYLEEVDVGDFWMPASEYQKWGEDHSDLSAGLYADLYLGKTESVVIRPKVQGSAVVFHIEAACSAGGSYSVEEYDPS